MAMLSRLRSFFVGLFKRSDLEDNMSDEIRFHLETRTEDLIRSGLSEAEARRRARLEFGSTESYKERCRQNLGLRLIDELRGDLRYALRILVKRPLFTIVALITLGFGIGVNTAVFSFEYAAFFKPIPVEDPWSLYQVKGRAETGVIDWFSYREYLDLKDRNDVFTQVLAESHIRPNTPTGAFRGYLVSGNYFASLGVRTILGSPLLPDDDQPVVVLGHDAWQARFAADPQIVGQHIVLAGHSFTVVGVATPDFKGIDENETSDLWAPLATSGMFTGRSSTPGEPTEVGLQIIGRLRPGIKLGQAQAAIAVLLPLLTERRSRESRLVDASLESRATYNTWNPKFTRDMLLLFLPFVLVLLIACSNLANVQLASALTRRREIGVRLSLGASRARVIRQLVTESAPIAVASGILALFVSHWSMVLIRRIIQAHGGPVSPFLGTRLDSSIVGFAMMLSVLAALVFGLLPALQATRTNPTGAMKREGDLLGSPIRRSRLRDALVVVQFALSLALLITAGGLFRSATSLAAATPGCDTTQTLGGFLFQGAPPIRLSQTLAAIPGVRSVARGSHGPLMGWNRSRPVPVFLGPAFSGQMIAGYSFVSAEYFDTLGIPIVRGRAFTQEDTEFLADVAIVSQATARRFWPDEDPLGRQVRIATWIDRPSAPRTLQVVGVAGDVITGETIDGKDGSFVYLPTDRRNPASGPTFLIRVEGNPGQMLLTIQSEVSSAFPAAEFELHTMEEYRRQSVLVNQISSSVAGATGLLGLVLASLGIYGVMAYLVGQRTHEIGIRVALGAERLDVIWLVLRDGCRVMILSVAFGLLAGLGLSRFLAATIFRFNAADPLVFLVPAVVLVGFGVMASYLPARRATQVEPSVALRYE